jgi:NADH-quinone oxidoreductase subunit L
MEAPTPISALIHAATMVNAGVYLLARFYPAFSEVPGWTFAVTMVGMITALLAALMALVATDLKRVLAYSTVSQLGYMVYAIGCGNIFAAQFHLLSHSVFKALLFLSAGAIIHAVGTRDMLKMGGLAKKMPVVATVFCIGALALAGIPPLNGFWSKELVLESGFLGPYNWSYYFMLLGAGLTALYTARMVWLVFFGTERSHLHAHDAGNAMKVALIPLALGTLTTWLLAGSFSDLLKNTLPFHEIEMVTLGELVQKIFTDPMTYLALLVVAVGIVCWFQRQQLEGVAKGFSSFSKAAQNSFGFEAINRTVVKVTQEGAEALRPSQTGVLAWNVAGILLALIIVLLILISKV